MGTVEVGGVQGYSHPSQPSIAGESMDRAKQLSRTTWQRTLAQLDQRKGTVVQALEGFASSLENVGQQASSQLPIPNDLTDKAAGFIRQFSRRIEQGSSEELLNDVENQFRARPGAFMAGLVAIGFFAGRILRR